MAATSSEFIFFVLGSIYFVSVTIFIGFELWQRLQHNFRVIDLPAVPTIAMETPPPPYTLPSDAQTQNEPQTGNSPVSLHNFR